MMSENVKPPPMQDLTNIAMYCQTYADGYVKDSARAVIRWMNTIDSQLNKVGDEDAGSHV